MIHIYFDEYGEFEKKKEKLVFIAGFIYDDKKDSSDFNKEEIRIEKYLKKVIKDAKVAAEEKSKEKLVISYPQSLHFNKEGNVSNQALKYVKAKIEETLPEFIKEGTYKGKKFKDSDGTELKRIGCYHFFSLLKGNNGIKYSYECSKMIDDEFASNLYFHMASRIINKVIFYNPLYASMPEISIVAPTRTLEFSGRSDGDYIDLAYHPIDEGSNNKGKSNIKKYRIMNSDTYRTVIAQEMIRNIDKDIKVDDFRVFSINYDDPEKSNVFLYLADSICSVLQENLSRSKSYVELSEVILNNINPDSKNMVFAYDEIDTYYENAWSDYEKEDYYGALSIIYDMKYKRSEVARYYNRVWFKDLEEKIVNSVSARAFEKSVGTLFGYLSESNIDQGKIDYIYKTLLQMADRGKCLYADETRKADILFKLYECGVTACCHKGDSVNAIQCYNKCINLSEFIDIEKLLKIRNKLIVACEDLFAWDNGEEYAYENMNDYEKLASVLKEIMPNYNIENDVKYGKIISQYARILALKRNPEAEKYFRKALEFFRKQTADYKITQSYLLHFYLDNREMEKFEEEATDYFDGKKSYLDRIKYINAMNRNSLSTISKPFAYYVLYRGLFYDITNEKTKREITDKEWNQIIKVTYTTEDDNSGDICVGHPWEIIFKYLRLLSYVRGDKEKEAYFKKQQESCLVENGVMVDALILYGEAEFLTFIKEYNERTEYIDKLCTLLKNKYVVLKDKKFSEDDETRYNELSELFTFMYH